MIELILVVIFISIFFYILIESIKLERKIYKDLSFKKNLGFLVMTNFMHDNWYHAFEIDKDDPKFIEIDTKLKAKVKLFKILMITLFILFILIMIV